MGSYELSILLMMLLTALVLWFTATAVLIFFYGQHGIIAVWREPVWRRPVMIIESDDWGAGTAEQADALEKVADTLICFADRDGRRPVMTLGMILATADGEKTLAGDSYQRQKISMQTHQPLLDIISHGVEDDVFSVQLHGMEHFWPEALMAASREDTAVNAWLAHSPEFQTEDLPSHLQTRWVDASVLPARRLDLAVVRQAVQEEVHAFSEIFGAPPMVAVPPTFVWNDDVESAWASMGIGVIVTPGYRYETRNEEGLLAGKGRAIYSGQPGENAIVYLVRDAYFEPSFGHTARQALDALSAKTSQGRPTLFEMHRFNFLGTEDKNKHALNELERLLRMSLIEFPDLAFLSSEKMANILRNRESEWLEQSFRRRLHTWITRLGGLPRLRKLAWLTGWMVPAGLIWRLTA